MPRVAIPIPTRYGVQKSPFVAAQTLINCFTEIDRITGEPAVYGGPGLTLSATIGNGPIRGLHNYNDEFDIAVSGTSVYTKAPSGSWTSRGTIQGDDSVIIANNGFEACIVSYSAEKSYLLNGTTLAVTQITDADFPVASSVDFIDQYLAFTKKSSGQWFISGLADGSAFDAADIVTAESRPDKLLRLITDNREVIVLGSKTIEGYYNSGNTDFPFDRSTTFVEYGLAGRLAVARADNTFVFLASDKTIRALRGGNPEIISDHAVANLLESWGDLSEVRAFAFPLRGHTFVAFRHASGCVVIDMANNLPHLRQSQAMDTWRVGCCETLIGGVTFGDATSGAIYTLDADAHDENSAEMTREMVSMTLGPQGAPFTLDEVEIEVEVGVGQGTGQGAAPQVWLQLSRDSGRTWGARMQRNLGAAGVRNKRVVWSGGFGQFPPHGGAIKIGMSDPARFVLTKAHATFTPDTP